MRLIDANALLKYFEECQNREVGKWCDCFLNDAQEASTEWWCVEDAVTAAPTIDAVPVVHGRWIWHEDKWEHECSHCHCGFDYDKTYLMFDHGYEYASYCPNCGAKMDGQDTAAPTNSDRGCSTCANDGYDMPQCRECTERPGYPWYKRKDGGAK